MTNAFVADWSFWHFRSNIGLANHVKRLANVVIRLEKKINIAEGLFSKEWKGIQVVLISKAFDRLLRDFLEESKKLDTMDAENLKIEKSEEDFMEKLDREMAAMKAEIEKNFNHNAALLASVEGFLRKLSRAIHLALVETRDERHEMKNLFQEIHQHSIMFDQGAKPIDWILKIDVRRGARKVRRLIRREKKAGDAIRSIENNLEKLEKRAAIGGGPSGKVHDRIDKIRNSKGADAEKLAKSLDKEGTLITNLFKAELKIIFRLIHDISIVHVHLLRHINQTIPTILKEVTTDDFPEKEQFLKDFHELGFEIHKRFLKLYRMANFTYRATKHIEAH
ncbi:MAG: hypothetical protein ABIE94_00905 [archaeon]